jgi:hypothetical protein
MTTKNISFAISTEELLVVLGYLKAESMPGLDSDHLKDLNDEQLEFALGIAERALYARGFIIPDHQKKPILAPTVFSVVGACVMPETTMVASSNRAGHRKDDYYYHTSRQMVVMHYAPNAGIHQFMAVNERADITRSILSILQLGEKPMLHCRPLRIHASVFGEARKAVQQNHPADGLRLLTEAGVDSLSAQIMVDTQSKPVANTTIGFVEYQNGKESTDSFTVIEGENGLWIVTTPENKSTPDPELLIAPASAEAVIQRVKTLMKI